MSLIPRAKSENAAKVLAQALANEGQVDSVPQSLSLTILERCNLACRMCDQGHHSDRELSAEALARLKDALAGVQSVCLTGGEPLLHPGLMDFLDLCFQNNCQTVIQTNATLLTESRARLLIERGVSRLKISVDGARPATYNRIRVHADFTRVMANIAGLNRLKVSLGSRKPELEFNFVAMRENIAELPRLVRLAAGLGVVQINVFPLLAHTRELCGQSLYFAPDLSDASTVAAMEEARALGVKLNAPPLFGSPEAPAETHAARRCTAPWDELTVNVTGDAALCCGGAGLAGNLNEQSFAEVWNHPARVSLRRRVNTPAEPACCRDCRLIRQDPKRIHSHIPDPDLARQALAEHGRQGAA